jgi:hypothetical protein
LIPLSVSFAPAEAALGSLGERSDWFCNFQPDFIPIHFGLDLPIHPMGNDDLLPGGVAKVIMHQRLLF